ncbi:MAG: DUF2188 domain-containing protein [Myxococcota bacterium]
MLQWTPDDHPPVFDSLDDAVRTDALERANALLVAGKHPTRALSIGISRAMDAAEGVRAVCTGTSYYVRAEPTGHRWQVAADDAGELDALVFDDFDDAVFRASELAREADSAVYIFGPNGDLLDRYEFFDGPSNQYTLTSCQDGWAVRGHGTHPCHETFPTKAEALDAARDIVGQHGGTLRIHYQAGGLQREETIAAA